jgi:hypothetical protein
MTLEQFAEDTITNWYAMGEKDFIECLEIAESLGLWNFAAELKLMEKVNMQEYYDKQRDIRLQIYNAANPFKNESNIN